MGAVFSDAGIQEHVSEISKGLFAKHAPVTFKIIPFVNINLTIFVTNNLQIFDLFVHFFKATTRNKNSIYLEDETILSGKEMGEMLTMTSY